MKERVKPKMEKLKERSNKIRASDSPTKPERSRKLVSDHEHFSFASGLLVLANQAAAELEEDDSSQVKIVETLCNRPTLVDEEAETQGKRRERKTVEERVKAIVKSLSKTRGKPKGLSNKKRVKESVVLGGCKRKNREFVETFKQLSFGDLLVLANAASVIVDAKGSPEKLRRNQELMQQFGKEAKPNNRDVFDELREGKLLSKKYPPKKRLNNENHLMNVDDDARRKQGLYKSGETRLKSELGRCCSGILNKSKSKTLRGNETEATAAAVPRRKRSYSTHIEEKESSDFLSSSLERGYKKKKRSQLNRKPKEPKRKNLGSSLGKKSDRKGRSCRQINSSASDPSEDEEGSDTSVSETETEEESDGDTIAKADQDVVDSDVSESGDSLPLVQKGKVKTTPSSPSLSIAIQHPRPNKATTQSKDSAPKLVNANNKDKVNMEKMNANDNGECKVEAKKKLAAINEVSLKDVSMKQSVEPQHICKHMNGDLMQQRGTSAQVKGINEAKRKRDPCADCREERLFKQKYFRKKRRVNKPSSLIIVDDTQRDGEAHSNSKHIEAVEGQGQGHCSGVLNNQEIPKRKRSKCTRILDEPKKYSGDRSQGKEQTCELRDDGNTISEAYSNRAVMEPDEETVVSDGSSSWWSFATQPRTGKGLRNVQWKNKKKRSCMTLEETHRNLEILLLAVEAITHQLRLLDVSM